MSEAAPMLATGVSAAHVEAGVLSLLEHSLPPNDRITNSTSQLSLSAVASIRNLMPEDIDSMVVPHDPTSHQARAVAALQQADTVNEHQHHLEAGPVMGDIPHQRVQGVDDKHQFSKQSVMSSMRREPVLRRSIDESDIPAVAIPVTNSSEPAIPANASDYGLSSSSTHSICLCQAPTRIPRPRNAFILFRQHHHAAVAAQHPGKPNPEISKIIGQMWKGCGDEIKAIWQGHADEEKRHHLQRYPQYRYQPRRSGKKTTAAGPVIDPTLPTPPIESAICPNCGGRTGALPTPQAPANTLSSRKATQESGQNAARRKASDVASHASMGSENGTGVEQAGVEALLQLGLQNEDDDLMNSALQSPPKRRKLDSPSSEPLSGSTLLQHNLYSTQFGHGNDPNIDPYLRTGSFDHESVEHENGIGNGNQLVHYGSQSSPEMFSTKTVPILKKIQAISKICPPISSMSAPPFNTPTVTRMPIISVDGDDVEVVGDLFHALSQAMEKTEPMYLIDEPDDLMILSEAYLEGLLSSTGAEKDKEADDADAARYLSHVSEWRRRSSEIRKIVTTAQTNSQSYDHAPPGHQQPQSVLINRYILSRSESAASRLSTDGLTPMEHWKWCADIWRSCVGPDMTIYVQSLSDGNVVGDDAVDSKYDGKVMFVRKAATGKGWSERVIRRLVFEIGEMTRSLKGFPV